MKKKIEDVKAAAQESGCKMFSNLTPDKEGFVDLPETVDTIFPLNEKEQKSLERFYSILNTQKEMTIAERFRTKKREQCIATKSAMLKRMRSEAEKAMEQGQDYFMFSAKSFILEKNLLQKEDIISIFLSLVSEEGLRIAIIDRYFTEENGEKLFMS